MDILLINEPDVLVLAVILLQNLYIVFLDDVGLLLDTIVFVGNLI